MSTVLPGARDLLSRGLSARDAAMTAVAHPRIGKLLAAIAIYGLLYGGAMGTFAGIGPERWLHVFYSAVKVPLLLLATFLISLPSFFVINTLLGLRDDFADAVRALMTTQAALTIILSSLAPLTLVWYAGTTDYLSAVVLNVLMFAVASFAAQGLLRRLYRPLVARSARHRILLRAWIVIYAFVGIQMGWTLRPFIGDPTRPPAFLRPDAWEGNAYIRVAEIVWTVLRGWMT